MWNSGVFALPFLVTQVLAPPAQVDAPPKAAVTLPAFAEAPPAQLPSGLYRGETVIVVVPASRDSLLGYSKETGRWDRQLIRPSDETPIEVLVSGNVAAVRVDNRIYGFSGIKGGWDSITVSPNGTALPELEKDAAVLVDGGNLHVFSAKSGEWRGVNLQTGKHIH